MIIPFDEYNQCVTIRVLRKNAIHIIPLSFFTDVVNGKRSITELEKFEDVVPKIIEEWLESLEREVK